MTPSPERRERDIIRAFVSLSQELVDDYDVVDMLVELTINCAKVLDVASAGLLLADHRGVLHLAASSSERMESLELLQLQRDEGPCLDCYRDGAMITIDDLATSPQARQWPQFAAAALKAGYHSVHAVPMKLRGHVLGGLGLFGDRTGQLEQDDLDLAQALAHVATIAIINGKSSTDRETVNAQLQHALTSRITLEQAKGIVAHSANLDMHDAFTVLRQYARRNNLKLTDVASRVVDRSLRSETLIGHVSEHHP